MKEMLDSVCRIIPDARERMLAALQNDVQYGLWEKTTC
jgi:hypothetical protein